MPVALETAKLMVFELATAAAKTWRRKDLASQRPGVD
jgi:hypothetical protein